MAKRHSGIFRPSLFFFFSLFFFSFCGAFKPPFCRCPPVYKAVEEQGAFKRAGVEGKGLIMSWINTVVSRHASAAAAVWRTRKSSDWSKRRRDPDSPQLDEGGGLCGRIGLSRMSESGLCSSSSSS